MDKQELLNKIYVNVFDTIKIYDFKMDIENHKLNKFQKTTVIANLSQLSKDYIKKLIHTYENEKYAREKADKFGYKERFGEIKYPNYIKKQELINEYIECLERLNTLNSELYNLTELYEEQYMIDFNHELFNVFKNKLGYYTKLSNKIKDLYTTP